jgi:hypothetical protein
MTGEPTLEPIVFNPSRELTRDELLRLAKFAGNFGLDPAFQVEEQISQDDKESLLKLHLGETFPKTKDDYLGTFLGNWRRIRATKARFEFTFYAVMLPSTSRKQ